MDKKDIGKSYNPRAFEKSDASLDFIKTVLGVITILAAGIAVFLGFRFMGIDRTVGWLLVIGGPLLFIFLYFVLMFVLWTVYDIKMIRNALYDAEASAHLNNFESK